MRHKPEMTPFERKRMDELQAQHDRDPFPEGTIIDISQNWAFMIPRQAPTNEGEDTGKR